MIWACPDKDGLSFDLPSCLGFSLEILEDKRGIPSKRESLARAESVPAFCTHRPSLLPIEHSGERIGFVSFGLPL